jgi:hypothetical protein
MSSLDNWGDETGQVNSSISERLVACNSRAPKQAEKRQSAAISHPMR